MPSFPVEFMTLSEIQRAATAHHRFDRLVSKSSAELGPDLDHAVPLAAFSKISSPVPSSAIDKTAVCKTAVIPGGRYMLAAHAGTGTLSLWDLVGYAGKASAPPKCVTELKVASDKSTWTFGSRIEGHLAISMPSPRILRVALTLKSDLEQIMFVVPCRLKDLALMKVLQYG